jgi:hypothetical protein
VGAYLLSEEPEAQRDLVARRLVSEGSDPIELLELDEAIRRLRRAPKRAWSREEQQTEPAPAVGVLEPA